MKSFLRWVGGKRKLLPVIKELLAGVHFTNYYEPFVGGGALFFDCRHQSVYTGISDINDRLMDTYSAIQENCQLVIQTLRGLHGASYDVIKEEYNSTSGGEFRTAALFLMLNHLCFNGLYRENKAGMFNVPIGKHGSTAKGTNRPRTMDDYDYACIERAGAALKNTVIRSCSFEYAFPNMLVQRKSTLVFCDPPYLKEFSSYNKSGFTKAHHCELAHWAVELRDKGAHVIVCGSNNDATRQIYGTPAKVVVLKRTVGAGVRGDASEALYLYNPK